jgi:hypothetical protein
MQGNRVWPICKRKEIDTLQEAWILELLVKDMKYMLRGGLKEILEKELKEIWNIVFEQNKF